MQQTCDSCQRKLHRECADLSASEFKVMDHREKRNIFCLDCCEGAKLIYKIPELIDRIDSLQKTVDGLNKHSSLPTEELLIEEIYERQKRANNVMVYYLLENNQQLDLDAVKAITRDVCDEEFELVKTI